ncbi:MAG: EAL domain-containing protein, partial [Oscillospiraceae bacterium]
PVYSLSQGKTVSAEALVRWIHPESGIIAPNNFIPLFEKNGFITKLDFYMMDKTCQFLSNRRKEGKMPIPVSVNLSRRSIYSRDITGDLTGLMEKYDLSPSELKLEITETAYTDNPEQLKKTVIELQKRGFIILMDDFGSGYSSLNMLKDLPVDILKIDMKFLENFDVSSRAGNIVTSVVRMAKWLKLPVIAEGVETRQQVNFLSSLGCDMIQGYYFSRPITIEDFEKFVLNDGCASGEAAVPKLQQSDVDMIFGGNQFVSQIMSSAFGALGFYELNGTKLEAIRVNDGYYKIYGMNPKSFSEMADNALKHVHPDDVEKMLKACNQSIITNKTQRLIIRAFHNDGHL